MEKIIHQTILKACETQSHEVAIQQVLTEYQVNDPEQIQFWQQLTAEDCANATPAPEPTGVRGECSEEFASIGELLTQTNLTWRSCWLEVTADQVLFKTKVDTTAMRGRPTSPAEFMVTEQRYNFPEAMGSSWLITPTKLRSSISQKPCYSKILASRT
ncbi:MAG: hypothetical protein HC835_03600 [Oscillatoriales cyanobacterium RM2_1_1]|nr:hypothetical protein [Oscillatoriales cyanobacterium SM2_3_0]NJO44774.1 hypothetical protein [Oscillatoriales cyanobacterium RM2_1_1]